MTKMRDRILFFCSILSLFFIVKEIKAQECSPTTTNGVRTECTASAPICSLPYTYQYDYTNQESQTALVFNDRFDNLTDGWLPLSVLSIVSNDFNRLKVERQTGKTPGSLASLDLGVYKNFNAVVGKTYTLTATIDKGTCNPASSIEVNVKDAGGNVVATTSVSSGGISYIYLQFTPSSTGVYSLEFKRIGNNSVCSFFLDNIVLKYLDCTVNSLWHYFYLDANQIDLLIKDNISGLVDAKLYGPFNQSESPQLICSGIISGSIPAVADGISISGNTVQLTASNLTSGWYALEVNDNDCSGCIEINSIEGQVTCSPSLPCPTDIIISCESSNPNLVINGNFELGDSSDPILTGFTSDYNYASSFPSGDGTYSIITSAQPNFNVIDHTFGNGQGYFMFAHPVPFQDNFAWNQTVSNIIPNNVYEFTVWIAPQNGQGETNDKIKLLVNNQVVAAIDPNVIPFTTWYKLSGTWSSAGFSESSVELKILMENRDDAYRLFIDDISFKEICHRCVGNEVDFIVNSNFNLSNITLSWDFGDGTPTSENSNHIYTTLGTYMITATIIGVEGCNYTTSTNITIKDCIPPSCEDCIGSFKPIPGSKYVLGAWAKEDAAPLSKITYDRPKIIVHFYNASHQLMASSLQPFLPSGMIIDGWQRIEEEFIIPAMAAYVGVELIAEDGDVYFDDIRVFPFDASMKSYVYDPVNMRLVAELDERNYATFYEYDEEGKLTRIKKETERGIMTIQETRYNTSKP